ERMRMAWLAELGAQLDFLAGLLSIPDGAPLRYLDFQRWDRRFVENGDKAFRFITIGGLGAEAQGLRSGLESHLFVDEKLLVLAGRKSRQLGRRGKWVRDSRGLDQFLAFLGIDLASDGDLGNVDPYDLARFDGQLPTLLQTLRQHGFQSDQGWTGFLDKRDLESQTCGLRFLMVAQGVAVQRRYRDEVISRLK